MSQVRMESAYGNSLCRGSDAKKDKEVISAGGWRWASIGCSGQRRLGRKYAWEGTQNRELESK